MPEEPQIGLHVSIAGSLDLAFDRAAEVGCNTFQIFTRNPNQWKFKPITAEGVQLFLEKRKKSGFRRIVAHMPYLPNLASPVPTTMKVSRESLREEVKRCDSLGVDYLVTHLGSHLGAGSAVGMKNVAGAVNEALRGSSGDTTVLLENMAGQMNSVGSRFEELAQIIEKVKDSRRVGVCFDTCHAYAAGFDLGGVEAVDQTMGLFEETIGLDKLMVVHLNDSKGPLGKRLDRHENVGKGKIGKKGLRAFVHSHGILARPLIVETPYEDLNGMKQSIATVRGLL